MEGLIDIGDVRARTGLPASTLHYYERHGLIRSAGRTGLRRQYEPDTIERLAVIVLCQGAGLRLDEIGELLATRGEAGWKDLVRAKLAEVESSLHHLRGLGLGNSQLSQLFNHKGKGGGLAKHVKVLVSGLR